MKFIPIQGDIIVDSQQVELLRKWKHLVLEMGKFLKANSPSLRSNDEKVLQKALKDFEATLAMAKEKFEEEWYKLMEVEMKTYDKNEARLLLYNRIINRSFVKESYN